MFRFRHAGRWDHPHASDITPESLYRDRRRWLQGVGLGLLAGSGAVAVPAQAATYPPPVAGRRALMANPSALPLARSSEPMTPFTDVTSYNNFYEFSTDKGEPARLAQAMRVAPWSVEIDGLVAKPGRYALEDLMRWGTMEERIYRLRCVEGWSMVIPWVGYSLQQLLQRVQPLGSARYVEFHTLADPTTMPGVRSGILDWPYVEGLRLDEAMHPLTLLSFGLYGQTLAPQNGAPVRLVVPWKYGFKSGKSLIRIRLTAQQPLTSWQRAAPREYGFYANVNPAVDHPRWSQATERRIGEGGLWARRRTTEPFNGYAEAVASLYSGMDLRRDF